MSDRATMNGKPVFEIPVKSVINFKSGFEPKLLCDGPTFSTGTACAYSCTFCYVPAVYRKMLEDFLKEVGKRHDEIVIRRANAIPILRSQLTNRNASPKYRTVDDTRVIYSSPAVDVAANMDLVRETIEACRVILELTNWQIRLLSKSNLLPKIAQALTIGDDEAGLNARNRVIYGVSTGTLDNKLAAAFELDCPLVSKRIESLHWLQDNGFRTFGMICPSLPQVVNNPLIDYYEAFASEMCDAIRGDRCEHVWAEVINVRGESMIQTEAALRKADYHQLADALHRVSTDKTAWEQYSRDTFTAHARLYSPGKLRFLQYVNNHNRDWWTDRQHQGAVLL